MATTALLTRLSACTRCRTPSCTLPNQLPLLTDLHPLLTVTGLGLGLLLHDLILGPHSFFFRRSQCVGHSSHVPCVYPSGFDSNNPDGSSGSSGLRAFNWQDPNQTAITLIMFAQLRYLGIDLSPQQQLLHDQLRLNQQITAVKALEAGESLAPPSSGGSGSHGSPPPSVSIMLQPRTPMQLAPQPSPGGQQQQQQQQQEGKNGKGQDQKHEAVKPGSTRKLSKQEEEEERQRLRGISHRPGSTGILMVGGGKDVLGNAVVSPPHSCGEETGIISNTSSCSAF
jgi:hypothetical protein